MEDIITTIIAFFLGSIVGYLLKKIEILIMLKRLVVRNVKKHKKT